MKHRTIPWNSQRRLFLKIYKVVNAHLIFPYHRKLYGYYLNSNMICVFDFIFEYIFHNSLYKFYFHKELYIFPITLVTITIIFIRPVKSIVPLSTGLVTKVTPFSGTLAPTVTSLLIYCQFCGQHQDLQL